jgi:hypothetical protein
MTTTTTHPNWDKAVLQFVSKYRLPVFVGVFVLVIMFGGADAGTGFFYLSLAALAYMIPSFVAFNRRHRQRTAITILNIFGGWTLLGWVGALVWACTTDTEHASGNIGVKRFTPVERMMAVAKDLNTER